MRILKNKTKTFYKMRRRRGHGKKTRRKEKTHARKTHARKGKTRRRGTRRRGTRRKGTGARKTRARGLCSSKEEVPTLSVIQQRLNEQKKRMKNINDDITASEKRIDEYAAVLSRPLTLKQAKRVHKMTSNAIKEDGRSRHEKLKTKHLADTAERRQRYYERR